MSPAPEVQRHKFLRVFLPFLVTEKDGVQLINKENLRWLTLAAIAILGGFWAYQRSLTISIVDARIASDVVVISSNRSGWVTRFSVASGDQVKAGELLVQIDDRTARLTQQEIAIQIATNQAEIERAHSERGMVEEEHLSRLETQKERLNSARYDAKKEESSLKLARSNYDRSNTLLKKTLISKKQWEEDDLKFKKAEESYLQAKSRLLQETSKLRQEKAQMTAVTLLDQKLAIMEQDIQRLRIKEQQLALDVEDRQVRSPIDGVIDKTFGHAQEFVSPGRRLVMMHDPDKIWINANIKETQLRHIAPGMKAKVFVDAYPDHSFDATVSSIDQATTSEFALLPNPNPSGNFTKVTQRLRMKLSIEQTAGLLRPGMMVEVRIDLRS